MTINRNNENMEFIINRSLPNAAEELSVVEVGHSFPQKGKRADAICTTFQLHYVVRGKALFRGEEISSGMGFLVLPGESQNMSVESNGFEQYWVNFSGLRVQNLLYECGIPAHSHSFVYAADNRNGANVEGLLQNVFAADFESNPPSLRHTYLVGLLCQLLAVIQTDNTPEIPSVGQYVSAVCSYIQAHYPENLTVEWISAAVGLSSKYLMRIFRRETGKTLIGYLTQVRLDAACKLLLSTNKSISEIAASVGYTDALYFSKVFRAEHGTAPSAWRINGKKAF